MNEANTSDPIELSSPEEVRAAVSVLIDAFLARHRMSPSTFGRMALSDSTFVTALRRGRNVTLGRLERAGAFMRAYDAASVGGD